MERVRTEESEPDRVAAVERLLRWYLATADSVASVNSPHRYHLPIDDPGSTPPPPFTSAEDSLAWYDSERANLVAAIGQAASEGIDDVAWRLPTALFSVFNRRSNWADCAATHRIALDSVRSAGNRQGEGWVKHNLGVALVRMRDKEGLRHLEDALAIRREIADAQGEVQAALNIADAYHQLEGAAVALERMLECLEVVRRTGRPPHYATALHNLGDVYLELGRLDEAVACFTEVGDVARGIGDAYTEGHALHNLGHAYLDMGRTDDAREAIRAAIAIHRSTGNQPGEALALTFLGRAQRGLGEIAGARQSWSEAIAIFTRLGDSDQVAEIESKLAALA
jgi:tetratricopeptide (TPR) repeat protein